LARARKGSPDPLTARTWIEDKVGDKGFGKGQELAQGQV